MRSGFYRRSAALTLRRSRDSCSARPSNKSIITEAAALAAVSLAPGVRDYLFASHCSADPLAGALLTALDLKPLISAGMHLGEGTGAVAALPLLDMAEAVYSGADSFTELGIAAYTEQGGKS